MVAIAFFAISFLPASHPHLAIAAFALAGLGCSALLPLTMSFAEEELTTITASVAGGLIAFYQIGYGIAAFGVGPLQGLAGLELNLSCPNVSGGLDFATDPALIRRIVAEVRAVCPLPIIAKLTPAAAPICRLDTAR